MARVIDNTTQPLRTARQVFEEVEEIAFSFKRTRKVTVNSESSDSSNSTRDQPTPQSPVAEARPA
ncbi:integral membrane domain protein [Mycobacterium kansasii]|uniref:Integral membrane domain protein n=1 Tax=Mycobacterium kansasii TaxID=1768 RepID=A0A1V3X411_MYCKA|nr:integral membrane domain protein [Mycobacterium kansasii]